MSDMERGAAGALDEDRLPWLEAVDDEDEPQGPGTGRLIAAVLVMLVAIGLVVGGIFWLRGAPEEQGDGTLIAAPEGAYKTRPTDPGGMRVEGEGESAYAASAGRETNAAIDLSALPEAPVTGAGRVATVDLPPSAAAPAPNTAANTARAPVAAPPARPAPAPAPAATTPPATAPTAGGTIQLGAFSSEAKANAAWTALSKRFAMLAPLPKSVTPVTTGSGTLYRLRVSAGGQAAGVCQRLKVAGETCAVIG